VSGARYIPRMLRSVLLILLVASCATKKDPPREVAAAAIAAAPTGKLTCDRVFPQAVRDRHFAGATTLAQAPTVDFAAGCDVKKDQTALGSVVVTCHPNMKASRETTLASLRKNLRAVDVPGVGAAAVLVETGGSRSISAWDDDSDCHATVTAMNRDIDLTALSKDVLSALPPR
jgi:hypothetical protein